MRSVASRLGVSAMALYHHVAGKEELLRLVGEAVSSTVVPLRLGEDSWENALRRYLLSTWEETFRYPGVGEYLMGTAGIGSTPRSVSRGVHFFEEAGFPSRLAELAWSCSLNYIHGRLSVESLLHSPQGRSARLARLGGFRPARLRGVRCRRVIAGLRTMLDSATPDRVGVQSVATQQFGEHPESFVSDRATAASRRDEGPSRGSSVLRQARDHWSQVAGTELQSEQTSFELRSCSVCSSQIGHLVPEDDRWSGTGGVVQLRREALGQLGAGPPGRAPRLKRVLCVCRYLNDRITAMRADTYLWSVPGLDVWPPPDQGTDYSRRSGVLLRGSMPGSPRRPTRLRHCVPLFCERFCDEVWVWVLWLKPGGSTRRW